MVAVHGAGTRPRRGWRVIAGAGALAFVAAACSSTSTSTSNGTEGTLPPANQAAPTNEGTPTPGGTLRVGLPAEVDGVDPVHNHWSLEGNLIGSALFDTLLTFDENRVLVPRLALSVLPNKDGTVWTIKLRPNVKFTDGTPMDASVVKANIDARKTDQLSKGSLEPIDNVVVVDPLTAEVHMNTPWFGYDATLAAQAGYMEAPAQIASGDQASKQAIGTGPFKQTGTFTSGQPITAERNPDYWGDKPLLNGISFTALVDASARTAAVKAHDMDLIFTDTGESILEFRDLAGFKQVEDVAAEEEFVINNMSKAPLDNIHARTALAYATDQKAVIDAARAGIAPVANGPYNVGEKYYSADAGYPGFDLDKAKQEVELYKKDTGQAELSFVLSSSPGEKLVAEILQGQWAAAGIKVTVDVAEQTTFLTNMFFDKFQAAMFRNFAYVNPDSNFIFWDSSQAKGEGQGSVNFGQLKDPKLDAALRTARANPDEASRTTQYEALTKTLNETVPFVWLFHNDWALVGSDQVGGLGTPQKLGFARQDGKPWWPMIWLKS